MKLKCKPRNCPLTLSDCFNNVSHTIMIYEWECPQVICAGFHKSLTKSVYVSKAHCSHAALYCRIGAAFIYQIPGLWQDRTLRRGHLYLSSVSVTRRDVLPLLSCFTSSFSFAFFRRCSLCTTALMISPYSLEITDLTLMSLVALTMHPLHLYGCLVLQIHSCIVVLWWCRMMSLQ